MKHIKKLVTITLIIVLCVLIYYRYANKDSSRDINKVENDSLSEVERVLTKNLDEYYPKTPLEVVKFFTRIQKCYYNEDNTDEIVNELADLAKKLMDEELLKQNPEDEYLEELKEEIAAYKKSKRTISNIIFDKTTDVVYSTVEGKKTASLNCTYYLQTGDNVTTSKETYILRKNDGGQWKIYGWKLDEPSELEK